MTNTKGPGFSSEQQAYLQGLVMGSEVARAIRGLPVLSGSGTGGTAVQNAISLGMGTTAVGTSVHAIARREQEGAGKKLVPEEKAKEEKEALELWGEIEDRCRAGVFPKGTDVFLTKFHGLFYVAPAQDAFMCRLRLPGGVISAHQFQGVADLSETYAGGFVDITTRANLQMREIKATDGFELLMGLRDLGIETTGAGADNIRNVTASPLSGIDPSELIETIPLAKRMHQHILHRREMYGLPRKFNIAFDGGGAISALAETNDVSFQAVEVEASAVADDLPGRIYFLLGLGGITGHGDFARPTGILVLPEECTRVAEAIVMVFARYGNRTDRKKARLKYLLDAWGQERFLLEVEKVYGKSLRRVPADRFQIVDRVQRWAHVGVHPQKQSGKYYVGAVARAGRVTAEQARGIAALANQFGSREVRLTVWQNFLLPHIHEADLPSVLRGLEKLDLAHDPSAFVAGLVACTGNAGCKFAASNTKGHAMRLAEYLQQRHTMDQPLNIHLTGCHHSCAQHSIADIGLLATKVQRNEELVEGYHVFLGGTTGSMANIAEAFQQSVPFEELPNLLDELIATYLEQRLGPAESFAAYCRRIGVGQLRHWWQSPDRQQHPVH